MELIDTFTSSELQELKSQYTDAKRVAEIHRQAQYRNMRERAQAALHNGSDSHQTHVAHPKKGRE